MAKFIYFTARFLGFLVFRSLFPLEIRGKENIPVKGPCLIIANHISFLDAIVVGCSLPLQVNYFAKSTLFEIPVLAAVLRCIGAMPLDRESPASLSLRMGLKALGKNRALVIFPEGTRSKTGERLPPKPGIGFLHVKTRAPIIPALIKGSDRAMPVGAKYIRPGAKITISFGPAFISESRDYKKTARLAMDEIKKLEAL